jgi:hypothetical protein
MGIIPNGPMPLFGVRLFAFLRGLRRSVTCIMTWQASCLRQCRRYACRRAPETFSRGASARGGTTARIVLKPPAVEASRALRGGGELRILGMRQRRGEPPVVELFSGAAAP